MDQFFSSNLANFVWALAAFAVFVLIFYRLAVKHVLAAVDAREARIKRELDESEDAYRKAKGIKEELEAKMRGAEARIAEMIAEATKDGEAHKNALVEKGRAEIEAIRVRAIRDIEAARHTAIVSLRKEVAEISVIMAEKIVQERVDPAKQEQMVALAIEAFEARQKA